MNDRKERCQQSFRQKGLRSSGLHILGLAFSLPRWVPQRVGLNRTHCSPSFRLTGIFAILFRFKRAWRRETDLQTIVLTIYAYLLTLQVQRKQKCSHLTNVFATLLLIHSQKKLASPIDAYGLGELFTNEKSEVARHTSTLRVSPMYGHAGQSQFILYFWNEAKRCWGESTSSIMCRVPRRSSWHHETRNM